MNTFHRFSTGPYSVVAQSCRQKYDSPQGILGTDVNELSTCRIWRWSTFMVTGVSIPGIMYIILVMVILCTIQPRRESFTTSKTELSHSIWNIRTISSVSLSIDIRSSRYCCRPYLARRHLVLPTILFINIGIRGWVPWGHWGTCIAIKISQCVSKTFWCCSRSLKFNCVSDSGIFNEDFKYCCFSFKKRFSHSLWKNYLCMNACYSCCCCVVVVLISCLLGFTACRCKWANW